MRLAMFVFLVAWCHICCPAVAFPVEAGGDCLHLNDGWRFSLDMSGEPEAGDFDDSGWRTVTLPNHAREISDELPRSTRPVWFRRRFQLPAPPRGFRVVLRVDSVRAAQAWVNGRAVGTAADGASVLEQDVTATVRPGENLLAIRAPVPGIAGGVRIFVLPPVHFLPDGLLIDTPDWQGGPATVRVRSSVGNQGTTSPGVQVSVSLRGDDGGRLAEFRSSVGPAARPGGVTEIVCRSPPIPDPPLWSTQSSGSGVMSTARPRSRRLGTVRLRASP